VGKQMLGQAALGEGATSLKAGRLNMKYER